jgi:hypothetical protein
MMPLVAMESLCITKTGLNKGVQGKIITEGVLLVSKFCLQVPLTQSLVSIAV